MHVRGGGNKMGGGGGGGLWLGGVGDGGVLYTSCVEFAAVQHTRAGVWRQRWVYGGIRRAGRCAACGQSSPIVHNACMRGLGGEAKANAISRHATL